MSYEGEEMTDDRIAQIANEYFMDCNQLTRHQFINFGRAIEAECRGVPDYVWMIGTKGFMALFATEEAANDWQQMNGTNTPASYIQPVSIPVISAAPKPDPERKHEIVPTMAEPDCECGAVASEHCPACEPVAQEPFGIWHQGDTEEESDFFLFKDSGDVSCPNCIKLYTAPPDQSAELATANAVIESERTIYRGRIAELEAIIEAQRTLYASAADYEERSIDENKNC